jgi:diguanylate cyclase (GGDEF)-like protein
MNVLLGALCLRVAGGERDAPALRAWGFSLYVYTFGLLAVMSASVLPRAAAAFTGNALIAWAPLISLRALLWHTPTHFGRRWIALALAPVVLVLAADNFVGQHRPLVNIVAPTLLAIGAFAFGGLRLLLRPPAAARDAARLVAGACLVAAGVWILRLLVVSRLLPIDPEYVPFVTAGFAIAQLLVSVAATFGLLAIEVRGMEALLRREATSDPLTGLPNRTAVAERFRQEVARAARQRTTFALTVFDIDDFKRVNDLHGHLAGDAMLRHVAATLSVGKRTEDVLARVGGEEFLLIHVGATGPDGNADGVRLADRLRNQVETAPLAFEGKNVNVTLSGGVAVYPQDGTTWEALFAVADERLYRSKREGRNRLTGPRAESH